MEVLQLKYFINVAKSENISRTAQKFRVPPSSVSASIKKLEEEFGVKLFSRSANRIKLNPYGRILLSAVETAEDALKKARMEMMNLSAMPAGEINLLILNNRRIVTDVIAKFSGDYPGVSFNIKHENHYDQADYHNFDLVISDRVYDFDSFERRDFVQEEVFLAMKKRSSIPEKSVVDLRNLRNEKFICMPKGSNLRDFMDRCFDKLGFQPEIVIECDDPHYICKYVKMGLGVTFFPSVSWKDKIDEENVLLKIDDGMYRHSYIYLNRNATDIVKIFADALELAIHH